MTGKKVNNVMKAALLLALLSFLAVSNSAWSYNKSWDQGHKCVNPSGGKWGWGRYDYAGHFTGDYNSEECCRKLCKLCDVYGKTGNLHKTFKDLSVPGIGPGLNIVRTYNSEEWASSMLGHSWIFNFGKRLIITRNKGGEKIIGILLRTGEKNFYREGIDGTLICLTDYGVTYDLIKNENNTYTIQNSDGSWYELREDGKIAKILDKNQNELVFAYNSVGCLSRITNASGNYVDFQFGANGKIASVSDNLGRTVTYGYDENGNLISATDPLGNTTQYVYNSNNYLTQIIDARGNTVESVTYDNNQPSRVSTFTEKGETYTIAYFDGRTEKTDSQGNKWTYYFNDVGVIERVVDPFGNVTNRQLNKVTAQTVDWEEDPNGNRISYTYDGEGNIASKTDPLGNTWTYTYVAGSDLLETEIDPLGQVTKYGYDENGNVIIAIRDFGGSLENATSYTYDSQGNLTTITNPLGETRRYQYDSNGNIIQITDALGNSVIYSYDGLGDIVSETDPYGNSTSHSYDLMNRLTSTTDALGNTTTFSYDANGNMTSVQYADGNTKTSTYDDYDRPVKETDSLGNTTTFTYDKKDNILSMTDANGNTVTYAYDTLGRKIRLTNPDGTQTNYAYDANGNVTAITNANGNTTTYTYDDNNRLTQKTYPDTATYSYTYDAVGNKITETDANGNLITFIYDRLNRLITKTFPDGSKVHFTYDASDKMLSGVNIDSNITYFYDALGRITQTTLNGKTINYSYDAMSNRKVITTPEGETVQYVYDNANQMTRMQLPNGKWINYTYNTLGRIVRKDYSGGSYSTYDFDNANRLTQVSHLKNDGSGIYTQINTFDNGYNIISKTTGIGTTNYSYDKKYQLVSATHPTQAQENFTYDPSGNRLTSTNYNDWSYNNRNQLISYASTTLTYDSNGNTATKIDASGATQYSCDYENRLKRIDFPDGTWASYKYDVKGRRTEKNVNGNITKYIYDNNLLLAEYDSQGNLRRNYFYGIKDINPSILFENGNVYYFHHDHLNTPQTITNEDGDVLWKGIYESFGKTFVTVEDMTNNFRFPGQYEDTELGLYYNYLRYYNKDTGRYLTSDPIAFTNIGLNDYLDLDLYLYARNNPVSSVDPLGLYIIPSYGRCCGPDPFHDCGMIPIKFSDRITLDSMDECCHRHDNFLYHLHQLGITSWCNRFVIQADRNIENCVRALDPDPRCWDRPAVSNYKQADSYRWKIYLAFPRCQWHLDPLCCLGNG